jgi:hypothetical protein
MFNTSTGYGHSFEGYFPPKRKEKQRKGARKKERLVFSTSPK